MDFNYLNTADSEYLDTIDSKYLGLAGSIFGPITVEANNLTSAGLRFRIYSTDLTGNIGLLSVYFKASSLGTTISDCFIGLAVSDASFAFKAGSQRQLTFNGGNSFVTVSPWAKFSSDPILFNFLLIDSLLISLNQNGNLVEFNDSSLNDITRIWANSSQPDPSSEYPPAGGLVLSPNYSIISEIRQYVVSGYGTLDIPFPISGVGGVYENINGSGALTISMPMASSGGESRDAVSGSGNIIIGLPMQNTGWIEITGTPALIIPVTTESVSSIMQFFMNF